MILFVAALAVISTICSCTRKEKVQNVIYLIGDGMGFGAVSSLLLSENEATGFELGSPTIGLNETCSANNYVTDSPAGGTALATGTRTCNGYLGVDPDGNQLVSALKIAQQLGKKTGIVVNTVLTEATPGAFYAGVKSRSEGYKIAEQFVESGVDVAIGAGLDPFIHRPDSADLTASLAEKGYDIYLDWPDIMLTQSDKFVGILPFSDIHRRNKARQVEAGAADGAEVCFAAKMAAENSLDDGSVPPLDPTKYLEEAVDKALGTLTRTSGKDGFFLMIESAIIDGYGHNNDSDGMIEEMQEFDQTLKLLVKYVGEHPNTLLVVTADHETGGTGIGYLKHEVGEELPIQLNFSTKGHTGTVVPIFAFGAGSANFGKVMQNREIPLTIEALMRGEI
jgi:Alkaline phosphatase